MTKIPTLVSTVGCVLQRGRHTIKGFRVEGEFHVVSKHLFIRRDTVKISLIVKIVIELLRINVLGSTRLGGVYGGQLV